MIDSDDGFDFADRSRQYGEAQFAADDFGSAEIYRSANRDDAIVYRPVGDGLVSKMAQKIAAVQKIAGQHDWSEAAADIPYARMNINNVAVKLQSGQNFVTFYNNTMSGLNGGRLEYLYVNAEKDVVLAQYKFGELETVGSFRANLPAVKAGYYSIGLKDVYSNVSTGFAQHAAVKPASFRTAESVVRTDDGAETRALDGAIEHKFLRELGHAVSAQALKTTDYGMIGQLKTEARKPMMAAIAPGASKTAAGKLFDMRWTEGGVTMEMLDAGYGKFPEQAAQQFRFGAVSIAPVGPSAAYKMLFDFAFDELRWASALTVRSAAGKKTMTARSVDFYVPKAYVRVSVVKKSSQQPLCGGDISADVQIRDARYSFAEDVPSELRSQMDEKFVRFFEHSLEYYVQEALKQELCNTGGYGRY